MNFQNVFKQKCRFLTGILPIPLFFSSSIPSPKTDAFEFRECVRLEERGSFR